jgi:hypothetical protein
MKNTLHAISGVTIAACMLLGTSSIAQTMSSADFSAGKTRIKSDYTTSKKDCGAFAGNAKDICVADAKGKESVALAELDNSYKPTPKTLHKVSVAKGEAAYDVSKQKCDDLSGNPKDVCVKEAKAALVSAKADADVQMKTTAASTTASTEKKEVRADAAADKRAAELKVAQEKCDALASTTKDACMAAAQAKFGKL